MGLPIRTSTEITTIINNAQAAVSGLGLEIVKERMRGLTITNRDHRDKTYRLILLVNYLQVILDDNGNIRNWFNSNLNTFNQMLDGVVKLSGIFQGAAIPLLTSQNIPIVLIPGSTYTPGNQTGGGSATPGGTTLNATANSPSTVIDTFNASVSSFAFYILSVSGSNSGEGNRTSMLAVSWRGSNTPTWTESATNDVGGITTPLTFSFTLNAGYINLVATATTNGWDISGVRILINNISFQNPLGPLPSGGTTGQFLVKASNANYQTNWVTLTANLITDLVASATELNYTHGVTSAIQTQLNNIVASLVNYIYSADEVTLHLTSNTFSIKSTYQGQSSIITVGTLTSGATGVGFTLNFGSSTLSGIIPIANGGTGTSSPGLVAGTNIAITGSWPNQSIAFSGLLPISSGGTGSSSPSLIAGSNITVTGSWPNQTIAASGSSAPAWTNFSLSGGPSFSGANGSYITAISYPVQFAYRINTTTQQVETTGRVTITISPSQSLILAVTISSTAFSGLGATYGGIINGYCYAQGLSGTPPTASTAHLVWGQLYVANGLPVLVIGTADNTSIPSGSYTFNLSGNNPY